jgi:hypothetical protein
MEIEPGMRETIAATLTGAMAQGAARVRGRIREHEEFVAARVESGKPPKHCNRHYDVPVVTSQETELLLAVPKRSRRGRNATRFVEYDYEHAGGRPAAKLRAEKAKGIKIAPPIQRNLDFC